jgi:hypothetical protein
MQAESANQTKHDDRSPSDRSGYSDGLPSRRFADHRSGNVITKSLSPARQDGDQETYKIHADSVDQPKQIADERLSQTDGTPIQAPNPNIHRQFS